MSEVSFGQRLRRWRRARGLSQLQLALQLKVSPRHVSFLETGRSYPSRGMALRLAAHLGMPLREQNALLMAAGLAPAFDRRALSSPELAAVRAAASRILAASEPSPAVLLDRRRDVLLANQAAQLLCVGVDPVVLGPPLNVLRLLLHPGGLSGRIVGFRQYAGALLERHRRDAMLSGDPDLAELIAELEGYPGVGPLTGPPPGDVALTLRLRDPAGELAFFSTIATIGTPLDVTVSELVVETLFPADDATAAYLRARASGAAAG